MLDGDGTRAAQAGCSLHCASLAPWWGVTALTGLSACPTNVQGVELLSEVSPLLSPEQSWCWSGLAVPSCMSVPKEVAPCEECTWLPPQSGLQSPVAVLGGRDTTQTH